MQILKTPGCASCAQVERSWAELRSDYRQQVQVEVVDLLEHPELAQRHGVIQVPAVVIEGRLRAQGPLDTARLVRILDEALRESLPANEESARA